MISRRAGFCVLVVLSQLAACGWDSPAVPVRGHLAGEPVQTIVDSPIARYYVENYLPGKRANDAWDRALDAIHRELGDQIPTAEQLATWTRTFSADFAALIFAYQLLRQASEQPFNAVLREELLRDASSPATQIDADLQIVLVPGWLYKSDTKTGADFARFRALLSRHGAAVFLIQTGENLSVEDNAMLIEAEILRFARSGKRIVLVSTSKGGPEAALALSNLRHEPAARQIKAWLNIGGLLNGTPLADAALTWPTCWFVHVAVLPDGSFDGIRSLSTERSAARRRDLQLPSGLLVVNYVAVPFLGDVSREAREGYLRLKARGPNDGLTYLPDAIMPNGATVVELGADHYFRRSDIDLRALALARAIARYTKENSMIR